MSTAAEIPMAYTEAPDPEAFRTALAEATDTGSSLLAGLRTGDWLDNQEFPPLAWIVPGLMPEGASMVVGGPKIGKSWLVLGIALALASGQRALGVLQTGPPRPVLYLALEDGHRRLQDRCRTLLGDEPIPRLFHYQLSVEHLMVIPTIQAWLDTLAPEIRPLVILDTLGKIMPPAMAGESTYQRDYRIAGRLKEVCDSRPGMGLAIVHHDRKADSDDFVDNVSGTNGIAGALDTVIIIQRSRNQSSGILKVTGRDVPEGEYAVEVENGNWQLLGDDLGLAADRANSIRATINLGSQNTQIYEFVQAYPEGVSADDVVTGLPAISKGNASKGLQRLFEEKRITRPSRGIYAPVQSVQSVHPDSGGVAALDTLDSLDTDPAQPGEGR